MAEHERKTPGSLPTFVVSETRPPVLECYICPRSDCGGAFYVAVGELVEQRRRRGFETASCPFCMRVSLVPGTVGGQQALTDG